MPPRTPVTVWAPVGRSCPVPTPLSRPPSDTPSAYTRISSPPRPTGHETCPKSRPTTPRDPVEGYRREVSTITPRRRVQPSPTSAPTTNGWLLPRERADGGRPDTCDQHPSPGDVDGVVSRPSPSGHVTGAPRSLGTRESLPWRHGVQGVRDISGWTPPGGNTPIVGRQCLRKPRRGHWKGLGRPLVRTPAGKVLRYGTPPHQSHVLLPVGTPFPDVSPSLPAVELTSLTVG